MKGKWYRSRPAKWVLIGMSHVFAVILIISLVWVMNCPEALEKMLQSKTINYEETNTISQQMLTDSMNVLEYIRAKNRFETDGTYDGEKIVDIIELTSGDGMTEGESGSGLAYRLDDLVNWEEAFNADRIDSSNNGGFMKDPIVVCEKKDHTYEYYYFSEFKEKIDDGEFRFIMETEDMTAFDILNGLKNGEWYEDSYNENQYAVMDEEGTVLYVNCWNYDGYWIEEMSAPEGADSLLQIVNTDSRWNGKLENAYFAIEAAFDTIASEISQYENGLDEYEEGNTNLTYLYADKESKKIYTNCGAYGSYDDLEKSVEAMKKSGKYILVRPKLKDFESNIDGARAQEWKSHIEAYGTARNDFLYAVKVDTAYPIHDSYESAAALYNAAAGRVGLFSVLGIISAVGLLIMIIWLTIVSGRTPEDEEIHLNRFDRVKTEIAAALVIGLWIGCMAIFGLSLDSIAMDLTYGTGYASSELALNHPALWVCVCGMAVASCGWFLVGWLSLVRRIKARTVWKDSAFRWLLIKSRKVWNWTVAYIPSMWKLCIVLGVFLITQWLMASGEGVLVLFGLAAEVLVVVYIIRQECRKKEILKGVKKIAEGEVDHKISSEKMRGEEKEIAEYINKIGEGLDAAVEASLKNERLKTDLITNVSHDIKTPLTSIINYIDLLKRENFTDPKVQGYLDVLESKAQRLKTLTEDVVEASKVSSGNVNLQYMNIDLAEMIQQTSGEFSEKFEQRKLKEVLSLPEEPAIIRADGQRMWRVIENIYNNAAKYAMEGTRIYGDLKVKETTVVFTLKNISEQPLNISADELTERFIRGDISRSTEGSGLGLSIAKSITELMHGTFEIYLDGDLFRVTITMPRESKYNIK